MFFKAKQIISFSLSFTRYLSRCLSSYLNIYLSILLFIKLLIYLSIDLTVFNVSFLFHLSLKILLKERPFNDLERLEEVIDMWESLWFYTYKMCKSKSDSNSKGNLHTFKEKVSEIVGRSSEEVSELQTP